ncbi:MAG: helicase HerA-like domain-containing protein, partial [Saprospiraceae bacterium]
MKDAFIEKLKPAYQFQGPIINLGAAVLAGEVIPDVQIGLPLKMMNRHGLIAGATGTGKTKSLQVMAEQLSLQGVACLLLDIKGDLSGIALEGSENPKIKERHAAIHINWQAHSNPVELLSISGQEGVRMRATVSEFGPVLF